MSNDGIIVGALTASGAEIILHNLLTDKLAVFAAPATISKRHEWAKNPEISIDFSHSSEKIRLTICIVGAIKNRKDEVEHMVWYWTPKLTDSNTYKDLKYFCEKGTENKKVQNASRKKHVRSNSNSGPCRNEIKTSSFFEEPAVKEDHNLD